MLLDYQHVRAQWGSIVSWRACWAGSERAARVSRSTGDFSNGLKKNICKFLSLIKTHQLLVCNTVDSRYLAPFGGQNSRARVKWFSRYLALSHEGPNSRLPWIRVPHCDICTSYNQTVCWAIMGILTFRGSLQTSTSHQQQITTSLIIF